MATDATTDTFEQEVIEANGKVLVDFWAEWCGPCHAVASVLERIAGEHDIKLVKVDIDSQEPLTERFAVTTVPTMILFENGEQQAFVTGAKPKGPLERALGLAGS